MKFFGSFTFDFPQDKQCIVLTGRSNVGKSSLINTLANSKIARTSKDPGLTNTLNFYTFEEIYIVDTPGYGYAKRSKQEREIWNDMINSFFIKNYDNIICALSLIDALVGPTELDNTLIKYFDSLNIETNIILTKVDKTNQKELNNTLKVLKTYNKDVLQTSSKEGIGIKELRIFIKNKIKSYEKR